MSDPNEALARIRALLALRETYAWRNDTQAILDSLADAVHALDEWISKGGFLPSDWTKHSLAVLDNMAEQVAGAVRNAQRAAEMDGHYSRPPRHRGRTARGGGQNSGA